MRVLHFNKNGKRNFVLHVYKTVLCVFLLKDAQWFKNYNIKHHYVTHHK